MTEKHSKSTPTPERSLADAEVANVPKCGIVMPISSLDGCNEAHWSDVLQIVMDAVSDAGFKGDLVSNADDVGIIQKRIIQNLYDNPVVVCDVSAKNPNVMFELGIRLAFDKPTIIIKDDKTSYSFDTAPIEHLEYPRDLRFSKIVDFKRKLSEKIKNTHLKATTDRSYTTFLKNFGEFKVAKLEQRVATETEILADELKEIKMAIRRLDQPRERIATRPFQVYVVKVSGPPSAISRIISWMATRGYSWEPSIDTESKNERSNSITTRFIGHELAEGFISDLNRANISAMCEFEIFPM